MSDASDSSQTLSLNSALSAATSSIVGQKPSSRLSNTFIQSGNLNAKVMNDESQLDEATSTKSTSLAALLEPSHRHIFLTPQATVPYVFLELAKGTVDSVAPMVYENQKHMVDSYRNSMKKRKHEQSEEELVIPWETKDLLRLRKLHVDGMDTEQTWQQTQRVITSTLDFSEQILALLEQTRHNEDNVSTTDPDASTEAEYDAESDLEMSDGHESFGSDEENNGEIDTPSIALLKEEVSSPISVGERKDPSGDEVDDFATETYEADSHGLNDGFFSLEEFNRQTQWLEEQDARGAPVFDSDEEGDPIDFEVDPFSSVEKDRKHSDKKPQDDKSLLKKYDAKSKLKSSTARKTELSSGRFQNNPEDDVDNMDPERDSADDESQDDDDGISFGNMDLFAPDGASEDETSGDEIYGNKKSLVKEDSDDDDEHNLYYEDFFKAPAKRSSDTKRPIAKQVVADDESAVDNHMQHAMADVRRDLFGVSDDEGLEDEGDDPDDGFADFSEDESGPKRILSGDGEEDSDEENHIAGTKRNQSAHERRLTKLAQEIRQLEAANVAKRQWTLSGEAAATDRPVNSLLEEELDFEHAGKPVPVITTEVSEGIEGMIKRRILAREFDEVARRLPGDINSLTSGTKMGAVDVDDTKSKKSLAELYEEDHLKSSNPGTYISAQDQQLSKDEAEVESLWKAIGSKLDALCSWHYRPQVASQQPQISVLADVATIAMEDAQPSTGQGFVGSTASQLAPQEIYSAHKDGHGDAKSRGEIIGKDGLPLARLELSREERSRHRRHTKDMKRKSNTTVSMGSTSASSDGKKETVDSLRKSGVKIISTKGEVTDIDGNKARAADEVKKSSAFKL